MNVRLFLVAGVFLAAAVRPCAATTSFYPVRLADAAAVSVTLGAGGARGDGIADDTDTLQGAINRVQETTGQGIVFLPEGRYRITHTLLLWPGVRLIGYGAQRPVLLLADHTAGYGQDAAAYMVMFTGARPAGDSTLGSGNLARGSGRSSGHNSGHSSAQRDERGAPLAGVVPADRAVIDANPGTFYSSLSNIDFDMGEGNGGAVGIRMHAAQHCFLTHMEFRIRSGMAALKDIGNEAEDLHFIGGRYGIITSKPSPGWQFTLLDSSFEGQREAAIQEHEAGLTLVHDSFRHVPAAVVIDPGYAEELWIKDSRFEEIGGPAITISNEANARTQINAEGVVCRGVAVFARLRDSGKELRAPGPVYRVASFSHGLTIDRMGEAGSIRTSFDAKAIAQMPVPAAPAIRDLPAHTGWANVRDAGAKGDETTDDTEAIRQAIAANRTVYFPSGRYRVSDTITLRPDTVLIGLHPSTTQILLADRTPAFDGPGAPKPLLATAMGGEAIVSGIGLFTGGANSRAVAALWEAGKDSLMDDVRFLGGHGTNNADGTRMNPYNANHTADPDPHRRWDSQFPSLWVTNGGGGTFADIWTPDTFAEAGMYVSNTSTEGHVYELSSEHHVRMEVRLDRVANWELVALQTEEEHGEGPRALPLDIADSQHVLVANFHSYRVVGSHETYPYGVRVSNVDDVRFRNVHMDSDSKVSFDDAVFAQGSGRAVRFREFASLDVPGNAPGNVPGGAPPGEQATPDGYEVRKLAGGFYNIAGAALDPQGRLYFVDSHEQKVYRWSPSAGRLETICDAPLDAVNLLFDQAGDLMIVSYAGPGTVYALKQDAPLTEMKKLTPQAAQARPGMIAVLPADHWHVRGELLDVPDTRRPFQYVAPDNSTFLPAGEDFVTGALYYGTKMADLLRSFGLQPAPMDKPFYVTDEEEGKTYRASVSDDGSLHDLKLFAERGGEGVATDATGRVYLAAGEVFIYGSDGKQLEMVKVPERPIGLVMAGDKGSETLYVLGRTSLYAMKVH